MERRLFFTEGTEEFRKSLDDLPQDHHEQILRELKEIAEKWERDGYLPEDFIGDSVCRYKFFIRGVSYRLPLKVCTLSQDNIEHRVCVPIRIFPRKDRRYEDFIQKVKSDGYNLPEETVNRIQNSILSRPQETESNLPDCPEDLKRFLNELGRVKPYEFFSDTIIIYETEQFCDWLDEQDETFLDILHDRIYKLIEKVSKGEVSPTLDTAAQRCTFPIGQREEVFWYRVLETNQIKRLILATSASECEGVAEVEGGGTLRAYPSYILYDPLLWKDIAKGRALSLPLSEEEQSKIEDILIRRELPVFISGRAGSGKSTMLYYLFSNYWYELRDFRSKIILLTYTETLRKNAERQIKCIIERMSREKSPEHFDGTGIWTLRDFLFDIIEKNAPHLLEKYPRDKYLSYEKFAALLRCRYNTAVSPDICWHVIRTYIKGYYPKKLMRIEDYEKIPAKDKTVTSEEFEKAYDVYEWFKSKYPEYWDELDLVKTILTEDYLRNHEYYIIFCDEAQDFTRVELQLLLRLSFVLRYDFSRVYNPMVPIILAGDPLQTINPTGFRPQALREAYYQVVKEVGNNTEKINRKLSCLELTLNYRSSEGITKFSNLINLTRYTLLGVSRFGTPQRPWRRSVDIPAYVPLEKFNETASAEHFHIIIHPKMKDVIRENPDQHSSVSRLLKADGEEEGDQPNLWTPLEIKGLEQDCVVVYGFGEVLQQILPSRLKSRRVTLTDSEFRRAIREHVQREDSTELRIQLEYFFSNLYVAVTRAVKRLFVVDSEKGRRILWDLFLSEDNWIELLPEDKNGKDSWADKANYQELVVEDELSVKPIDPATEAEKYRDLWREERNPDYCSRAIKWYRKIGKDRVANELQADLYEYEERWADAARAHEEAGNHPKAAVCWLRAGEWKQAKRAVDICREENLILDWIRKWADLREQLEQKLSSLSEPEQDKWVAEDFTSWLDRTLSHLERMSGQDKRAARQETKRLIQDAQSRLCLQARMYLREKLLQEYNHLLRDIGLVGEIAKKLCEDYWREKYYERYVQLVDEYRLEDDQDHYLWAKASCMGTLEGLKWLVDKGHRRLAVQFWKDNRQPWIDKIAELSLDLAEQGDIRNALYVAARGNRIEDLSQIVKQIRRRDILSALQELMSKPESVDSEGVLLPLLFLSLRIESRDETFKMLQSAISRNVPATEIAKYVNEAGAHRFLIDVVSIKIEKITDETSLISGLNIAAYLLDVLSSTSIPEPTKTDKDLMNCLQKLFKKVKNIVDQSGTEIGMVAEKINHLYSAVQTYNFSEHSRATIQRDLEKVRQEITAIEKQNRTESGEGKVLKGDECAYKVIISKTQSVSSGEDDKAYFFAFTDTPIVVRLLKSERRLLCVNRDTGDSKSFFRSVKGEKEEPLWEVGVIRVVGKEATIELNGEWVMTVSVV